MENTYLLIAENGIPENCLALHNGIMYNPFHVKPTLFQGCNLPAVVPPKHKTIVSSCNVEMYGFIEELYRHKANGTK